MINKNEFLYGTNQPAAEKKEQKKSWRQEKQRDFELLIMEVQAEGSVWSSGAF